MSGRRAWSHSPLPQLGRLLSLLLVATLGVLCANAWFQANGSLADLQGLAAFGPRIPAEHNPEPGVLAMRKRRKGDAEGLRRRNALAVAQAATQHHRKALEDHWKGAVPVIGRIAPFAGPTTGGTRVQVFGTNFAGGSLYKCKFGHELVTAAFDLATGAVVCVSPPLGANEDALFAPNADPTTQTTARDLYTQPDPWRHAPAPPSQPPNSLDVKFSIAIFFFHENKTHHTASHDRKFHYYVPQLSVPSMFGITPTIGPTSGGTLVTVFATHVADWESYYCLFGSTKVVALHQNAISGATEYLLCKAPMLSGPPTTVDLSVHITGTDAPGALANASSRFRFEYYDIGSAVEAGGVSPPRVAVHVRPRLLPRAQSTLIAVTLRPVRFGTGPQGPQQSLGASSTASRRSLCRFAASQVVEAVFDVASSTFYCRAPAEADLPFAVSPAIHLELESRSMDPVVTYAHTGEFEGGRDDGSSGLVADATAAPVLGLPTLHWPVHAGSDHGAAPTTLDPPGAALPVRPLRGVNASTALPGAAPDFLADALQVLGNIFARAGALADSHHGAAEAPSATATELARAVSKIGVVLRNVSAWQGAGRDAHRGRRRPHRRTIDGQLVLARSRRGLGSPTNSDILSASPTAVSNSSTLLKVRIDTLCSALHEIRRDFGSLHVAYGSSPSQGASRGEGALAVYAERLVAALLQRMRCGHQPADHTNLWRSVPSPLFRGLLDARLVAQFVTFSLREYPLPLEHQHPPLLLLRWRSDGVATNSADTVCIFGRRLMASADSSSLVNVVWNRTFAWESLAQVSAQHAQAVLLSCSDAGPRRGVLAVPGLTGSIGYEKVTINWPGAFLVQFHRGPVGADGRGCRWHDSPHDVLGQFAFSLSARLCADADAGLRVWQQCDNEGSGGGGVTMHWDVSVGALHWRGDNVMCVWQNTSRSDGVELVVSAGVRFDSSTGVFALGFVEHDLRVAAGNRLVIRFVEFHKASSSPAVDCGSISRDDVVWAETKIAYCPEVGLSVQCPLAVTEPHAAPKGATVAWKVPNEFRGVPTTMCVFHTSPSNSSRLILASMQPLSTSRNGSQLAGLSGFLGGAFGASLLLRLEQSMTAAGHGMRPCDRPRATGQWLPGTLWQAMVPACELPMRVGFSLHYVPTNLASPFRLLWTLNTAAEKATSPWDLICLWLTNADGTFLRYEDAFVSSRFPDGIPLSPWQFSSAVKVSQRTEPRLVARFEPRASAESGGCRFVSTVWGEIDLSRILHPPSGFLAGHATSSVAVEVSFNGQDFHADTGLSRVTFFDPWRWNVPSYSPGNASVSVDRNFGFEDGGTLLVVEGVPFVAQHQALCIFNATATSAMAQDGRFPTEALVTPAELLPRHSFQPPSLTCVLPALARGRHHFSVQLDGITVDSFAATSPVSSLAQPHGEFLFDVFAACGVTELVPTVLSCGDTFSVGLNCSLAPHVSVQAVLESGSPQLALACLVSPRGSVEVSGATTQTHVRCRVPPHTQIGWNAVSLRIGTRPLAPTGVGVLVIPQPKLFGVFPSRGGRVGRNTVSSAVLFVASPNPAIGPVQGGTVVTVEGVNIAGGSGYRCRFGGQQVEAVFVFNAGVPTRSYRSPIWLPGAGGGAGSAAADGGGGGGGGRHGVIRCIAPPAEQLKAATVEFAISINSGADFVACNSCSSEFVYYAPDPPLTWLSNRWFPTSVPSSTGATITVLDVSPRFLTAVFSGSSRANRARSGLLAQVARTKCVFSVDVTTTVMMDAVYDAHEDILRCVCPAADAFSRSGSLSFSTVAFGLSYVHDQPDLYQSMWIGNVSFFYPAAVFPAMAIPSQLDLQSHGDLQFWPSTGPRAGGNIVTLAFQAEVVASAIHCHFGEVAVEAVRVHRGNTLVAQCAAPPFARAMRTASTAARLYLDVVPFVVETVVGDKQQRSSRGNFLFVSKPVPLSLSPMFGAASSHTTISLRVLNISNHCQDIFVAFGASTNVSLLSFTRDIRNTAVTVGVADSTAGLVVAKMPVLPSGVYAVALSVDGGMSFHLAPGRFVSMHDSRLTLMPSKTASQDGSTVSVRYGGFSIRNDKRREAISAVRLHAPLIWPTPQPMQPAQSVTGSLAFFDWTFEMSATDLKQSAESPAKGASSAGAAPHFVVLVSMVEVTLSPRIPRVASSRPDWSVREDFTIRDTNNGHGWVFIGVQRSRHETADDSASPLIDWHMLGPATLHAAVAVWGSLRRNISVGFFTDPAIYVASRMGDKSATAIRSSARQFSVGVFDPFDGVLSVDAPVIDAKETTVNGVASSMTKDARLRFLSISDGALASDCYGSLCAFSYDSRYDDPFGVERVIFRIVPAALTLVNQTLAFNLVSRWFSEQRIAFDVAASLGIARDRVVVTHLDAHTGVVQVELLASSLPADPSVTDLAETLKTHIHDTTSPLYDGITTWATDPLFVLGGKLEIGVDGAMYSTGRCSQADFLTKHKCLSFGKCGCTGISDRVTCLHSNDAGNYPCSWTPSLEWDGRARTRIQFAHCSDPAFVSQDECEWEGFCSNRSFVTKPTCLDDGFCVPYRDILSRRECERRNEPVHSSAGQCTAFPPSSGYSPCHEFGNKVDCGESRRLLGGLCGMCSAPSWSTETGELSGTFPFHQFATQVTCENPTKRNLVSVNLGSHSCTKRTNNNPCFPLRGVEYPRGFDCSMFTSKTHCVLPVTRPKRMCLMYPSNSSAAISEGHCPPDIAAFNRSDRWRPWIYHNHGDFFPDFRFPPLSLSQPSIREHLQGPPCLWDPPKPVKSPASIPIPRSKPAAHPCSGPAGVWKVFQRQQAPQDRECHALPLVDCKWNDTKSVGQDNATWVPTHIWNPHNTWHTDPTASVNSRFSCPCHWQSKLWHLTKCNWRTCGPGAQSAGGVSVLEMPRLKGPDDWVSDYQAFVVVGGLEMWMTLDSAVATTWVISKICFMQNCVEDRLFVGAFIPSIPPNFVVIDLFERGLLQLGAIFGLLGHTYVNLAGTPSIGCPIALGILDLGQIVGPDGFNHTGSIGLGFWEDNLPNWITFQDPALSLLTFLKCGNIFYPIPGCPVPVPKTFQLWGLPWFFPGGLVFKFSFFFGDLGGCFFLKGSVSYMTTGPTKWVFAIPVALKLLAPSWLFILSDVRVRGRSIHPCMLGICKATIHTGQFSIAGPLDPMLLLLEQVAVAKTCEGVEVLPDITWVIMGSHFTMNRAQYVVESEAYGEKECLTAFTPVFQLIPGFDMFTFGDVWIHAFYTIFEVAPLKRVGFAVSDQRYYEKNGCVSGSGQGPATDAKSMEDGVVDWQDGQADDELQRRLDAYEKDIGWKRYQNWMADLSGMAENTENDKLCAELGAPYCKCGSGFRFKEGSCVKLKHAGELDRLRMGADTAGVIDRDAGASTESVEPFISQAEMTDNAAIDAAVGLFSTRQRYDGDGTSAATRFWSGKGGSGFTDDTTLASTPLTQVSLFSFIETRTSIDSGVQTFVPSTSLSTTTDRSSPEEDFEKRKTRARAKREEVERLARTDRVVRQVEPGALEQVRFLSSTALSAQGQTRSTVNASAGSGAETGTRTQIELTTKLVTSRTTLRELYRNASMVLAGWAPHLNVTDEQLKGWWRGESEDFIRYQRAKVKHDYDANVQKARLLAHSFKVKNLLNKRLLRRVAAQMTVDAQTAEEAFNAAEANIDGDGGQPADTPKAGLAVSAVTNEEPVAHPVGTDVNTKKQDVEQSRARSVRHQKHVRPHRRASTPAQTPFTGPARDAVAAQNSGVVIRRNLQSGQWEAIVPGLEPAYSRGDARSATKNSTGGTSQTSSSAAAARGASAGKLAAHAPADPRPGRQFGKPSDMAEAYEQLSMLQQTWAHLQAME